MATKIEWTDETWNPVTGCTKVSQGCKHCYAERLAPKVFADQVVRGASSFGPTSRPRRFTDVWMHHGRLDQPLRWKAPRRVFANSMSDLFHEDVPFEFIDQVFGVMSITTRHSYQVLTKRPQRMLEYVQSRTDMVYEEEGRRPPQLMGCPEVITDAAVAARNRTKDRGYDNCGPLWPLENLWLGVSVEDQDTADERIPLLLQTPAAVRFLSCEPLLGPVNLDNYVGEGHCPKREDNTHCVHWWDGAGEPCCACKQYAPLSWIIAGGESGPKARPSSPDWFRSLRDQCAATDVPFFFKQWGEWLGAGQDGAPGERQHLNCSDLPVRAGKKAAGRQLDGRTHDEYPAVPE